MAEKGAVFFKFRKDGGLINIAKSILGSPNVCELYEDLKILLLKKNEKLNKMHNKLKRAQYFQLDR